MRDRADLHYFISVVMNILAILLVLMPSTFINMKLIKIIIVSNYKTI